MADNDTMNGVMAEYTVRVVREGGRSKLELVIHDGEVVAEGELHPLGLHGHPVYPDLFTSTFEAVRVS